MDEPTREELTAIRTRVQKAFRWLRRHGFICRARYKCCSTCAIHGIASMAADEQKEYSCYWHWQDEFAFQETGILYLRFCYFPPKNFPDEIDTSLLEKRGGILIAEAMARYGLIVEWEEEAGKCIIITGVRAEADEA